MRAATLFSGIGAPETAMPGWDWLWAAEIEKFPAAVHAIRHGAPNLGDVTAPDFVERAKDAGRPDVLIFGSPCQSFSQAGRRLGLDDPRGNLALVALRLARELKPAWVVFENVPGLLSLGRGKDFAAFQETMAECGYFGAWRLLDAQYWGLAQRRRRLFFVGYLGDWRPPAAVLFEPESLRGYPEAGGKARQDIAGALKASSGGVDDNRSQAQHIVAHTLRAEGFDASEDGTGRGSPLVAYGGNNTSGPIDIATACNAHGGPHGRQDFETETFIVFDPVQITSQTNRSQPAPGRECHTLSSSGGAVVAYRTGGDGNATDALTTGSDPSSHVVSPVPGIRRLTPREWERLQGFPDDFTLIPWRRRMAADGPRYKAVGNSMAVPVLRWLLDRIERVDGIMAEMEDE